MGQIYKDADVVQHSADDLSDGPRVARESSQCTIKMEVNGPDMKDAPQDAPEECSYYHKYVIPEGYTDWMCDKSWPETDSEISEPPLYDEWVQKNDENEGCSSETDDESPESIYPGEEFTERMKIEMGFEVLEKLSDADVLLHMTPVTDFINNLGGDQLIQSSFRALESFQKYPLLGHISRIPFQTIRTLLQGLGQGPGGFANVVQWFKGNNKWSKDIFKALQAVQASEESKLRDIVLEAIWNGDKGNVVNILRPSIEALSYTDKSKLVVKMLETFESMHSPTAELPDDEDLEMC